MKVGFKKTFTKEMRMNECKDIMAKNPDKIPVICEKAPDSKIQGIEKSKFLLKKEFSVAEFISLLKKKLELEKNDALFLLVQGKYSLSGSETIQQCYDKYKDEDGFLYIYYSNKEVWG